MFKRLLSALTGKKNAAPTTQETTPADASPAEEQLITVYDAYGRELKITRNEWREKMLLPNLEKQWNNADELYRLILTALDDGFAADVVAASRRLTEIDGTPERAFTIQGIVLLKTGQLDAAEAAFKTGVQKVGETATLLTNLAKVQAERGAHEQAEALLWQALLKDPNMENGLLWWAAIHVDREGDAGHLRALQAVADLPGSWRAQLWIARHHLDAKELDSARRLYEEVLAGGQFDAQSLMMISGDLGNHGHIELMLDLLGPVFDAEKHDPRAGLNLLQACVHLARVNDGEALLARLYALNLAPYKQHLDRFANELQNIKTAQTASKPIDTDQLKTTTVAITQPIWQYGLQQPDWLLHQKPDDAPQIGFFALAKVDSASNAAEEQREDDVGRYTRAIPLYLAESAHYWTDFAAATYVLAVDGGGPIVFSEELNVEGLFDIVPSQTAWLVTGKIGNQGDAWQISLTLWDCATRTHHVTEEATATRAEIGDAVRHLEQKILAHVGRKRETPLDAFYRRPPADALAPYLTELGQLFMLTLVANNIAPKSGLWGERNMLDWPLNMALHWPSAEVPKLMYLSGLAKAKEYGSDVLPEYKARTLQLLKDATHANSVASDLAPLVWRIFGMDEEFNQSHTMRQGESDGRYRAWLERVAP
ncbi:lipopolysaccharide assembly protein LapB [Niveibacterium sp. COAC-50]|uniref:tetratricopeptide repeat protein n=1 Tax=Niveibacterium sp. COAC-50 TaxID=2729384 RepID=UPI001553D0EA|nr:tetratricopeptide repeat protein [Niveibacterium sp. COAC-50]